jgi:hypothetical protein
MPVPNIFGTATSAIPLSQLDTNFATPVTIGNTAVQLGNTVTSFGNVTLTNVTISSGNVTVSAGSNTAPSITTVGDTNTGIFFPAADTIAFSEGGVESMRIDASGNMGLGVTPSAWDTTNTTRAVQISSGPSIHGFNIGGSSPYVWVGNNDYRSSGGTSRYVVSAAASSYYMNAGAHFWQTAASGTAGNAITFTQAMTLNANGVLALQGASTSANGVGITFPATQSASTDANTLDDYEEGTFTPTLSFDGAAIGLTYLSQGGFYTKIGKQVTVNVTISLSNKGSSTGLARISGLPFTVSATTLNNPVSVVQGDKITFGTGYLAYYAPGNGTTFNPYLVSSGNTGDHLTNTAFANDSTLRATFSYFV